MMQYLTFVSWCSLVVCFRPQAGWVCYRTWVQSKGKRTYLSLRQSGYCSRSWGEDTRGRQQDLRLCVCMCVCVCVCVESMCTWDACMCVGVHMQHTFVRALSSGRWVSPVSPSSSSSSPSNTTPTLIAVSTLWRGNTVPLGILAWQVVRIAWWRMVAFSLWPPPSSVPLSLVPPMWVVNTSSFSMPVTMCPSSTTSFRRRVFCRLQV